MKTQVQKLEGRLKDIFSNQKSFVVTLNGKWGVGKTHFWNKFKKKHLPSEKKVSYVSLFGKESIQDIRTDIILQISKKDSFLDSVGGSISNIKSSFGLKDEEINFGLSGSVLSTMLTLLKKKDFKDVVICFDDFERISGKLSHRDILGLISELKEQKNCQIIMILNKDKIDDNTLSTYKDKIIDYEFEYSPTPKESYDVIKDSLIAFKTYPLAYFEKNQINNIRVMKRVINALNDFSFAQELTSGYEYIEREVAENIIELATINAMFMFKDFAKLSKYSLKRMSRKSSSGNWNGQQNDFKEKKKFNKMLDYIEFSSSGYFYMSDITDLMVKYIQNSMVDEEEIKKLTQMIETRQQQTNRDSVHNSIRHFYDKFNFNMSYTNASFTTDLFKVFSENADNIIEIINPGNFIFYINLLKELDDVNQQTYHDFAVNHLEIFIKNLIDSNKRFHSWDEDNMKNIRDFDTKLDVFYNEYQDNKKNKKVDSLEKVIGLMEDPQKNSGWGDEPHLLSTISKETLKNYILTSQEFVEECFEFIRFVKRFSNGTGFEEYVNKILEVFDELSKSGDENINVKMIKILDFINKKK